MGIILGRAVAGIIYPTYNLAIGASLTGTRVLQPLLAAWRSFAAAASMAAVLWPFRHQDWAAMTWPTLAATVTGLAAFGALTYVSTHLLLWQVAGRPQGAETRILSLLAQIARR
jgi:PST family polysaccharide transporter